MPGIELDAVEIDNFQGAYDAVHLLDLGHRRIGCVTGIGNSPLNDARIPEAIRQALDQAGIAFDPELLYEGDYSAGSGLAHGRTLLRLEPPTAAFAFNDLMAMGVMQAAHERGCASRPIWPSSASTGCR